MSSWCQEELATVDLGDDRRNERFEAILELFSERPNASIPGAVFWRAELDATYRFCNNKKVTPSAALQPHFDATTLTQFLKCYILSFCGIFSHFHFILPFPRISSKIGLYRESRFSV